MPAVVSGLKPTAAPSDRRTSERTSCGCSETRVPDLVPALGSSTRAGSPPTPLTFMLYSAGRALRRLTLTQSPALARMTSGSGFLAPDVTAASSSASTYIRPFGSLSPCEL